MLFAYCITPVKIGNGAGYLQDAGIGAGGEAEAVGDQLQHPVAARVQLAVFFDKAGSHLGITVDFGPTVAFQLEFTRTLDPPGDCRRALGVATVGKIAVFDRRHFDVDVNPVQQRPGNARPVAVDGNRGTGTGVSRVGKVAAGAGVC